MRHYHDQRRQQARVAYRNELESGVVPVLALANAQRSDGLGQVPQELEVLGRRITTRVDNNTTTYVNLKTRPCMHGTTADKMID